MIDAPDTATFELLARKAVLALPDQFREHLGDVVIRIEEFADDEQLRAVGLRDRWSLSGLYHGRPLSEQSIWASGEMPPVISLFRAPLLQEWRDTGVTLEDLITHVIVHEVGHHFGLSDEQMHAIEDGAD